VEEVDDPDTTTPGESPQGGSPAAESPTAESPTAESSTAESSTAEPQLDGPPEDADDWTDDQWISWLDATDDPDAPDGPDAGHPRHWSRGRSASMLGAAMLGLHEVIYGPHGNEIAIVVDAGGEPPGDDLPEVHLDPEHPERSEVIVRRDATRPGPDPSGSSEST